MKQTNGTLLYSLLMSERFKSRISDRRVSSCSVGDSQRSNESVFFVTGQARDVTVQQPKKCHIHPAWNSKRSLWLGSIQHDNDVVTFRKEIGDVGGCMRP